MALDLQSLLTRRARGEPVAWADRDVMLYGLAVGMGRDPRLAEELSFVYEGAGPRVLPSFASVLAQSRLMDDCGWDFGRVLHVGERLVLHQPLTDAGTAVLDSRVAGLRDLGAARGLLIDVDSDARAASGEALFTVRRTLLARGDGGGGAPAASGPAPHPLPGRAPDLTCALDTRPDQALLYRLAGDRNPLHADPGAARAAGFDRPLLHGLCTWGIACRAILATICEYDPTLIHRMEARFTAPAFPGDRLVTEMWQQANVVSFRVSAPERGVTVLDHGRCGLRA